MLIAKDIIILRKKNRSELVEHALRVYRVSGDKDTIKAYWVQRLLEGLDVRSMLAQLRRGNSLASEQLADLHNSEHGRKNLWYAGVAVINQEFGVLRAGMSERLRVSVTNSTPDTWRNREGSPINACYHWLSERGEMFDFEGVRTPLPEPIEPNSSLDFEILVLPPAQPGHYQLQLTLVHEGVCWFEERGFTVTTYPVDVEWCLPCSTGRVLDEFDYGKSVWARNDEAA